MLNPTEAMASPTDSVTTWSGCDADCYQGTKDQLIAAKLCEPHWFPEKLLPRLRKDGKPHLTHGVPAMKRTYVVEGQPTETTLRHRLDAFGNEFWVLCVAVSEVEGKKRLAEHERYLQIQDAKSSRQEEEKALAIEQIVASLPPVTAGSLTEGELHHIRVLRGVNEFHRTAIFGMAVDLLRFLPQQKAQRRLSALRLVVNNAGSRLDAPPI